MLGKLTRKMNAKMKAAGKGPIFVKAGSVSDPSVSRSSQAKTTSPSRSAAKQSTDAESITNRWYGSKKKKRSPRDLMASANTANKTLLGS